MSDLDTYKQISETLEQLLQNYFVTKFDTRRVLELINKEPSLVSTICLELDSGVSLYNSLRRTQLPPYLINAIELNANFAHDLPKVSQLWFSPYMTARIGSQLRDDPYFVEVWQIANAKALLCNVLLLIYRNTVLANNAAILLTPEGERRVQISSTLEEMLFYIKITGKQTNCYNAFRPWLKNWKEEGFAEKLFKLAY